MRILLFLIFLFLTPDIFAAVSFKLTKERGSTNFLAIGNPSAIRIDGKGEGPQGYFETKEKGEDLILNGQIKVSLKSYDTGIGLRDRHMKEKYLETEKFEDAILTISNLTISKTALTTLIQTKFPFSGTLNLHGMQKNVSGDFTIKSEGGGIKINAGFQIKLTDYGIKLPSFAGVTVADVVEVNAISNVERLQ